MPLVLLTKPECEHIALTINERRIAGLPEHQYTSAYALRFPFIGAVMQPHDGPYVFELSNTELRALDTLLTDSDPRGVKMPDGRPVMELLRIIWQAMLPDYNDEEMAILSPTDPKEPSYA